MSSRTVFSCDICGVDRRETNHWYWVLAKSDAITFRRWSANVPRTAKHVCGEGCAHRLLDQFVSQHNTSLQPEKPLL